MSDENEVDRMGIGGNLPPSDEALLIERLTNETSDIRQRAADLMDAIGRIPAECPDDETAGKISDVVKMVDAAKKGLEALRVKEKEPFFTLAKSVDSFFKKYTESLDDARKQAMLPLTNYLRKKEDEKRAAAVAEAKRLREESEKQAREAAELAAANMPKIAEETLQQAVRTDEQAKKAEVTAVAKPAELARTRGGYGSLATLKTVWKGRMTDRNTLDLEALRHHLPADGLDRAINSFVKAGGRVLNGATIAEESDGMVR